MFWMKRKEVKKKSLKEESNFFFIWQTNEFPPALGFLFFSFLLWSSFFWFHIASAQSALFRCFSQREKKEENEDDALKRGTKGSKRETSEAF